MKIRLFAYCIMDNHYHLVLENASDRLSDFQMLLNVQYGMYYRKMEGGKGYVFQSRFKSTLIENDSYLIQSIRYLLRNPVRLRGELLAALKERRGLKYREIAELDIFEGLSLISLRTMYKSSRSRCKKLKTLRAVKRDLLPTSFRCSF